METRNETFSNQFYAGWDADLDLQRVLETLLRNLWLIILAAILGGAAAWGVSQLQPPIYEARTQVLVTRASSPVGGSNDLVQYATLRELTATYAALLKENWIREEVSRRVGGEISKKAIKISTSTNTMLVNISVRDPDPERAVAIANTLVQVLIEQNETLQATRYTEAERRLNLQIQQVQAQIDALKQQMLEENTPEKAEDLRTELSLYQKLYLDLLDKRETLRLQKLQNMPNVVQVSPARLLEGPVAPKTLMNTLLGAILSTTVAIGAVFLREKLDTSVRREEDLEVIGLPLLITVAMAKDLKEGEGPYVMLKPRSPYAESLRLLRTNLEFLSVDAPLRTLLFTSTGPKEGKTTLAVNLGAIMAQGGKRVVVIDADMRRPRLHKVLGVVNRSGLSTLFRARIPAVEVCRQWNDTPFYFMTTGGIPPNPAELLSSERMRQILQELIEAFDAVILDAPPGFVAETQALAAQVDGVLISGRFGSTNRKHLEKMLESLRRLGARILGGVFIVSPSTANANGYGYSYSYYHSYDYESLPKKKPLV